MESKNANETTRLYKSLNQEQIENNPFLSTFLNWTKNTKDKELINMLDSLHLKSVSIGSFGRKAGYNHYPIAEPYFRFILHLGSPEAYYIDSRKPVAMLNGYGFFISPSHSSETSFTIYNEPIRLIHDPTVQSLVPKIRPKDYKRTILIYDYEFIPKDDVPEVVPEVVEEVVPEVVPQVVEEVVPEVVEEVVPEVVEEVIPQVVENTQVVEPPMTQAEKEAACCIC